MAARGIVNQILSKAGYSIKRDSLHEFPVESTFEDHKTMRIAKQISMTSLERFWSVIQSARRISINKVEGAFVERGVWKGRSSFAAMRTLSEIGDSSREFWLYVTLQGVNQASKYDMHGSTGKSA